jgi:hypothetical protein
MSRPNGGRDALHCSGASRAPGLLAPHLPVQAARVVSAFVVGLARDARAAEVAVDVERGERSSVTHALAEREEIDVAEVEQVMAEASGTLPRLPTRVMGEGAGTFWGGAGHPWRLPAVNPPAGLDLFACEIAGDAES